MRPNALSLAVVLSLFALPLAATHAGVDAELDGKALVKGRIFPESEVEHFRFEATAGSVLAFTVSAKKRGPEDWDVVLKGPDGRNVPYWDAKFADKGRKLSAKGVPLDLTGTYLLDIRSDRGGGDYDLTLKLAPRRKHTDTLTLAAGAATQVVGFAAPRGSRVTLLTKAAKRSGAQPQFVTLDGTPVAAGDGKLTPKLHKLTVAGYAGGDGVVEIGNRGTAAGDVGVWITVKPPRVRKNKLDLRKLMFDGTTPETLFSRTVDAETGGDVVVADAESSVDGAGVIVPPGALAADTRLTISSATPLGLDDPDAVVAVGPAVACAPEGTTFDVPVDVWLPYRPTHIPADKDTSDLTVLREAADGSRQTLAVQEVAGDRVRVRTQSFSSFQVMSAGGRPNLEGREYWEMIFEAQMASGGWRNVWLEFGTVSFGAQGVADGVRFVSDARLLQIEQRMEVLRDQWPSGPVDRQYIRSVVTFETEQVDETAAWSYLDDRTVRTDDGADPEDLLVSRDGSVLAGFLEPAGGSVVALDVLIEKLPDPTAAAVAGKYWMGEIEMGFSAQNLNEGGAGVSLFRSFGTLNLQSNGTFSVAVDGMDATMPTDGVLRKSRERETWSGTFVVDQSGPYSGSLVLTSSDDGEVEHQRLLPGAGGNVMLGTDRDPLPNVALFTLLVRQGSGMKTALLDGEYEGGIIELYPTLYDFGPLIIHQVDPPPGPDPVLDEEYFVTLPDFSLAAARTRWTYDGSRTARLDEFSLRRAEVVDQQATVRVTLEPDETVNEKFALGGTGKLTFTGEDPFVGALAPDALFGFALDSPNTNDPFFGFEVFLKPRQGP